MIFSERCKVAGGLRYIARRSGSSLCILDWLTSCVHNLSPVILAKLITTLSEEFFNVTLSRTMYGFSRSLWPCATNRVFGFSIRVPTFFNIKQTYHKYICIMRQVLPFYDPKATRLRNPSVSAFIVSPKLLDLALG